MQSAARHCLASATRDHAQRPETGACATAGLHASSQNTRIGAAAGEADTRSDAHGGGGLPARSGSVTSSQIPCVLALCGIAAAASMYAFYSCTRFASRARQALSTFRLTLAALLPASSPADARPTCLAATMMLMFSLGS